MMALYQVDCRLDQLQVGVWTEGSNILVLGFDDELERDMWRLKLFL